MELKTLYLIFGIINALYFIYADKIYGNEIIFFMPAHLFMAIVLIFRYILL